MITVRMDTQAKITNDVVTERSKMKNTIKDDGRVYRATMKQMMDYWTILTNKRGDELWRFFDGDDDKPRWKVWAVRRVDQNKIKDYKGSRRGADYFDTHLASKGRETYVGSDYIIPKKHLMCVSKLLGLNLCKDLPRPMTQKQKASLQKAQAALTTKREAQERRAA